MSSRWGRKIKRENQRNNSRRGNPPFLFRVFEIPYRRKSKRSKRFDTMASFSFLISRNYRWDFIPPMLDRSRDSNFFSVKTWNCLFYIEGLHLLFGASLSNPSGQRASLALWSHSCKLLPFSLFLLLLTISYVRRNISSFKYRFQLQFQVFVGTYNYTGN